MKKIDIETWLRKKHYLCFKDYKQPHFNITSCLDLSIFIKHIKTLGLSFFISFLYIVTKALNEIEEFRLRIKDDEVYLYPLIHPAYTVMTDSGVFDNCTSKFYDDFASFYNNTQKDILEAKQNYNQASDFNDETVLDVFYLTSIPWLDFSCFTHPMTNNSLSSIPRIIWGKYFKDGKKHKIHLNICVHHALIDAKPVALAYQKIQDYLNKAEDIIKL